MARWLAQIIGVALVVAAPAVTFREPHYAIARLAVIVMETGTLVRSALDEENYAWLKHSMAMTQFWDSGNRLLDELARLFLPGGRPDNKGPPEEHATELWRRRYRRAAARLREAGIKTTADENAAANLYVNLRQEWDAYIKPLATYM